MTIAPPLPEWLTVPGLDPQQVKADILGAMTRAIDGHERSQQVVLGPSEIGHACARRIAYQLLEFDENPGQPNWKATVGTACHSWMESVLEADNVKSYEGEARWITEATLECGSILGVTLPGHCDCYDQVTFGVLDWKFVGPTQLRKYKAKGPGPQYRAQAHTYGRGWRKAGRRVDWVGIFFFPRDGELRDAYFWSEPYDEQVALAAIQRVEGIALTTQALGEGALAVLPTADAFCRMCPFYKAHSRDLSQGCPGDPAAQASVTNPALSLG